MRPKPKPSPRALQASWRKQPRAPAPAAQALCAGCVCVFIVAEAGGACTWLWLRLYVCQYRYVSVLMEQNFTDFVGYLASLTNKADNCVCHFGRVLSHGEQPPPKCILVAVSPESTKHQKPHPRRCRPPHVERSLTLSRSHRATCLTFPSF